MNSLSRILPGIFACFLSSWVGLVAIPYFQLGKLLPEVNEDLGEVYPVKAPKAGQEVYIANGCINCHSQQVRPGHAGGDIGRGWGPRQTVARDYMYDRPLLVGNMRMGPDLANIGARTRDPMWYYRHFYNPRIDSPYSIMPPYDYLFRKVKISGERSADALVLPPEFAPEEGYQIVPKPAAKHLVNYLLSLDRTHPVPEAVQEVEEEEKPGEGAPVESQNAEATDAK